MLVLSNLYQLRSTISQFLHDHGRSPMRLEELVDEGYLRFLPSDPVTGANDTWITAKKGDQGIVNVWSGAAGRAQDGRLYRDW